MSSDAISIDFDLVENSIRKLLDCATRVSSASFATIDKSTEDGAVWASSVPYGYKSSLGTFTEITHDVKVSTLQTLQELAHALTQYATNMRYTVDPELAADLKRLDDEVTVLTTPPPPVVTTPRNASGPRAV